MPDETTRMDGVHDWRGAPDARQAPPSVVGLPTGKTDKERAAEYRERLMELLAPVCELLTIAERDGIRINLNISRDALGRSFISDISAIKPL